MNATEAQALTLKHQEKEAEIRLDSIFSSIRTACEHGNDQTSISCDRISVKDYVIERTMQRLKEMGYAVERSRECAHDDDDAWDYLIISWKNTCPIGYQPL